LPVTVCCSATEFGRPRSSGLIADLDEELLERPVVEQDRVEAEHLAVAGAELTIGAVADHPAATLFVGPPILRGEPCEVGDA
jgi:hypothetical protein